MTVEPAARPQPPEDRSSTGDPLTIEQVTAFDPPREYRLGPRDRQIAYTSEAGGVRQLFLLSLRGGTPLQLTASDHDVSDPHWSPDGRRLAFVRDNAIWMIDADGARQVRVTEHPAGSSRPRWAPDGLRLAFVSRRRGWSQVWLVDAPVPRRGRPAAHPRPPEPRPITPVGLDVEDYEWSPDGKRIALATERETDGWRSTVSVVEVATGAESRVSAGGAWECAPSWLPDGGLLLLSDADGWFQVVRLSADLRERTLLTIDPRDHGEPQGGFGITPLPAPDGSRFVHVRIHDGVRDVVVAPLTAPIPVKRGRGRPPKNPPPTAAAAAGSEIQPWPGLWRPIDWTSDGAWVAAIGESERRPQDLWLLPVPGVAPEDRGRGGSAIACPRSSARPDSSTPNGSPSPRATGFGSRATCSVPRPLLASAADGGSPRSSTSTAARARRAPAPGLRSSRSWSGRASRCSTSTTAARPVMAGRSAWPTSISGARPMPATASMPGAGPRPSRGPMGGWPSTGARMAAI